MTDNPVDLHPGTRGVGAQQVLGIPLKHRLRPRAQPARPPCSGWRGLGVSFGWVHGKSGVRPAGWRQPPRQVTGGARGRLHLALAIRGVIKHGAPSCHTFLNK